VEALQRKIAAAGADWRARVQEAFRRLVLERVRVYRRDGHAGLGRYVDGRSPLPVASVAAELFARLPCLRGGGADFPQYFAAIPQPTDDAIEGFLYWSNTLIGSKPILSVTHVAIARGAGARADDALVVGKQIFANHYLNGSVNLTAIVSAGRRSPRYLVILNRSNVDFIRGFFAGLTRMTIERKLKSELPAILDHLARTLESGPPPAAPAQVR
jgi:hypothetical protein